MVVVAAAEASGAAAADLAGAAAGALVEGAASAAEGATVSLWSAETAAGPSCS